jgi:energy-coupling factor transporter ATP-binding protein EcfA2
MIICHNIAKSYLHGGSRKHVLQDVNLTINRGDRVGLLGRNGAGKSTLIKLIGGVEMPTSGKVTRTMSVSWPLGFAGGFQGSLTGFDNARFIARIYQREYATVKRFVEDFTELGKQLRMSATRIFSANAKPKCSTSARTGPCWWRRTVQNSSEASATGPLSFTRVRPPCMKMSTRPLSDMTHYDDARALTLQTKFASHWRICISSQRLPGGRFHPISRGEATDRPHGEQLT